RPWKRSNVGVTVSAPGLLGGSDASTAAAAASATILSACAISAWVEASAASAADSACAATSASRRAIRPSSTSCRRVASPSRAWATASSRKGRRSARLARYSRAALTSSDGTGEDAPVTGAPVSASNTSAHAIGRRLIALILPRVSLDLDGGTPHSYGMTRLLLPDDVVFTCQQSGACCRNEWLIGVEESARARLEAVDWTRLDPPLPPGPKFRPLPFVLAGGERTTFARRPDGACVFLEPDERCGIHTRLGARAKPQACREFPYSFVEPPAGVAVGLSQVEAKARREDRAPTETLVGGLAQLEADRYRKVIAVAAQARYPREPRLTQLAPLYTWLEFSRRRPTRLGLVLALYRNFFR